MRISIALLAALAFCLSGTASFAKGERGYQAKKMPPGHMMQKYGSTRGYPGASGYAPGHNKRR